MTKKRTSSKIVICILALALLAGSSLVGAPQTMAATAKSTSSSKTSNTSNAIINTMRSRYDGSLANAITGRAMWYMQYGFMVYGHSKYATTGYIDCSNFVSLVYKDFGYNITSAARKYNTVGVPVKGVYVKNGKMVGVDKLKPGDIFTFQRTNYISHVAMYIGTVNGEPCFIGTTTGHPTAIGIVKGFNNWYGKQFYGVRRVLPDSAYQAGGTIKDKGPVIPAKYQKKPNIPIILPKNLPAGF